MDENFKLKKLWEDKWRVEISHQRNNDYMVGNGRCKGRTSKEFKMFVKNFLKNKTVLQKEFEKY